MYVSDYLVTLPVLMSNDTLDVILNKKWFAGIEVIYYYVMSIFKIYVSKACI